jgi:signal transduction histidine kinase
VAAPEVSDRPASILSLPATQQQRATVFAIAVALVAGFAITAPFASLQLPAYVSFNPTVGAMVFVNDVVTSILLFSQYGISRSRAILALAIGYLYTGLIVIPHILAFPGAFTGILDFGPQSSAWLYYFWTAGTPIAVIAYALLGDSDRVHVGKERSARSAIAGGIALAVGLVAGMTWLTTVGHRFLPTLVSGDHYSYAVVYIANPLAILIAAIALALLWFRRRSVLDYWLILMIFSLIVNYIVAATLAHQRYSLGFYASRGFTLFTSMLVLGLLLTEMTNLYTRLARSNVTLERERNNKLMSLEALAASISHEIRQPLGSMSLDSETALTFLNAKPPDVDAARSAVSDIRKDCHRANQVLKDIRVLFDKPKQAREPIDMNEAVLEALRTLRSELSDRGIVASVELATWLPLVMGHRGQLREVLLNLVHNAIEAMDGATGGTRRLQVTTDRHDPNGIVVAVKDTGPGIDPKRLDGIFDAFVTTKSHGMGLGLAICQTIIQGHGGRLSAFSNGKDGALFQFILPCGLADEDRPRTDA